MHFWVSCLTSLGQFLHVGGRNSKRKLEFIAGFNKERKDYYRIGNPLFLVVNYFGGRFGTVEVSPIRGSRAGQTDRATWASAQSKCPRTQGKMLGRTSSLVSNPCGFADISHGQLPGFNPRIPNKPWRSVLGRLSPLHLPARGQMSPEP